MADFSVRKIGTEQSPFRRGGDGGIRTLDLCVANAALSRLSYTPALFRQHPDYSTKRRGCQAFI